MISSNISEIVWQEITDIKQLSWGLTNQVYLVQLKDWEKVVVKVWDDLQREIDFFWYMANIDTLFPKLIDTKWNNVLIIEYKEGKNWKEVVNNINEDNRYTIWLQLGYAIKKLHSINMPLGIDKKNEIQKMIDYLSLDNVQIFDQTAYNKNLEQLRACLNKSSSKFILLHGDFSPHNCLFIEDRSGYHISAILDPSGRVWRWANYFDIAYLMNTRWNKNKSQLKKWFEKEYRVDRDGEFYASVEKTIKMYLAEIYKSMWDIESSKKIVDTLWSI